MSQDDTPDLAASQAVKVAPEAVALRAQPRPVTRLNRRTLAILVGGLSVAVLGATIWSLQSHRRGAGEQTELYNVDRVSKSERLTARWPSLFPVTLEISPVAKLGVGDVAKAEVAPDHLHKVKPHSPAQAVGPIVERSKEMEDNEKQGQQTGGRRNANPLDTFREWVLELYCKDSKLMLVGQSLEDPQVAASERIRRNNFVVNN